MEADTQTIAPFGPLEFSGGEPLTVSLGELRLEVVRRPEEIHYRSWTAGETPEEDDWVRWALEAEQQVRLDPATPDRMVVVAPEHSFHLPPKGKARIYVRLPVFLQLVIQDPSGATSLLADLASTVLSDTWWGSFTEGELAYWIPTHARRSLSDDLFVPHYAMCALSLRNGSSEPLPVDGFAVRVRHLGLFAVGGRLWTGETLVRYESAAEGSEIRFTGQPPEEAAGAERVVPPRDPDRSRFHARTFQRLRSLSHLGF